MYQKYLVPAFTLLWLMLYLSVGSAKTYIPIDKTAHIQSVDIQAKSAIIHMADYNITVPLKIMDGKSFTRAHGTTPKGMSIGLKYNSTLLRLIAIDAAKKNYMSVDLIAKDSPVIDLPKEYIPAIDTKEIYISAVQFIQSYPLWPANNVARGFDLMTTKEKHIIELFPAITLELADKLCRADRVTSGIFELLSNQNNLTCDNLSVLNEPTKLKEVQIAANQERSLLVNVLECAQGRRQPVFCQNVNKKLSDKILKSQTIPSLLPSNPS